MVNGGVSEGSGVKGLSPANCAVTRAAESKIVVTL